MDIYKKMSTVKFVVRHSKSAKRIPAVHGKRTLQHDRPNTCQSRLNWAIIGPGRSSLRREGGRMATKNLMKQHLCDVLYDMCDTRRFADITVTDVVRAAEVSRQTFYNHFIDLDDLICYAASRPLYSGIHSFTSPQNAEDAYRLSLQHRGFFTQLAKHESRNSYRASYIKWVERYYGELTVHDGMPQDEREFRRLSITAYASASIDLYFAWAASGMSAPLSTAIRALKEITPAFILEEQTHEREAPDYYPR